MAPSFLARYALEPLFSGDNGDVDYAETASNKVPIFAIRRGVDRVPASTALSGMRFLRLKKGPAKADPLNLNR